MKRIDLRIRDLLLVVAIIALAIALIQANGRIKLLERQNTFSSHDPVIRLDGTKKIRETGISSPTEFAIILYAFTDPEWEIAVEADRSLRSVLRVQSSPMDEPGFESERWREMRLIEFWSGQALEYLERKKNSWWSFF